MLWPLLCLLLDVGSYDLSDTTSLVLIDWGSSSFRLWCVDHEGKTVAEKHAPLGMTKLNSSDYEPMLENILSEMAVHEDAPVLICGMAGAAQGWQDANYIDLPARLDEISNHAINVKTKGRDVRIIPGLAQRSSQSPDVMRGEETLLLGALSKGIEYKTFCMPGTHSKWIKLEAGKVQSFKTFMTGELFALMSQHSTLSPFLNYDENHSAEISSFKDGVFEFLENPQELTRLLFSIRASSLLFDDHSTVSTSARLSGLLIGAELTALKPQLSQKVGLVSQGKLATNYAMAMEVIGIEYDLINSHKLALAGLLHVARQVWDASIWSVKRRQ